MKQRPWPLIVLAALQLLTPVINIAFNSVVFGVKPKYIIGWLLERSPVEIFETLALMPLAGLAILRMKRWSYAVFFVAMVWSMYANFRNFGSVTSTYSPGAVAAIYGFEILLVIYFLIPSVRETYFNPTVRWWESKPRYDIHAPATLTRTTPGESPLTIQTTVVNLSEGGAFLAIKGSSGTLKQGDVITLTFELLAIGITITGRLVYQRAAAADGTSSFGVQFLHTRETLARFHRLTKGLGLIGLTNRSDTATWTESFLRWAKGLVTTGQGWKPEIQRRRAP